MERRRIHIQTYGYSRYHGWTTLSDSANTTYEKEATGNDPLYRATRTGNQDELESGPQPERVITKSYQHGRRASLDTLLRGDENPALLTPDITIISPNGTRRNSNTDLNRCGGRKRTNTNGNKQPHTMAEASEGSMGPQTHPQRRLNALAEKTTIDDTIALLLESLATATQTAYLRSWQCWQDYCTRRGISPWMNINEHGWDMDLLTFLTWEYKVMGNGGSTLSTRFSAIRHLRMVEGRGDFDGKAYRVRALIDAVGRNNVCTRNTL